MEPKQPMNEAACIEWAGTINARWICHHELAQSAAGWMKHLETGDPERLALSCRHAFDLMMKAGPGNDPKPWFYAGLFSLATPEEQETWLANHAFTAAVTGGAPHDGGPGHELPFHEQMTLNLLERLQREVGMLRARPETPDRAVEREDCWIVEIPARGTASTAIA